MEHSGICDVCGIITPCFEGGCNEPWYHPYVCPICLEKERHKPFHSYTDVLDPEARFGE